MKSKLLKKVLSVALSAMMVITTCLALPAVVESGTVTVSAAEVHDDYEYDVCSNNLERGIQVQMNDYRTAVITDNNSLYVFGDNTHGEVGCNSKDKIISTPRKILDNVKMVEIGGFDYTRGDHAIALTNNGELYTWGYNIRGQLGNGTNIDSYVPVKIMDNIKTASLGDESTYAVTKDGYLYAWGGNTYGQLGNGTTTNSNTPQMIMSNVSSVCAGGSSIAVITTTGELYTFGHNDRGQLGIGTTYSYCPTPTKIMNNIKKAYARLGDGLAVITNADELFCWGRNDYGQIGNNTTINQFAPVKTMDSVESVVLTYTNSAVITKSGELYCWGKNDHGQIGDGTTVNRYKPVEIMNNVVSFALGDYHSAAVLRSGELYTWGYGINGEIGHSNIFNIYSPLKLMENCVSVSTGRNSTAVVVYDENEQNSCLYTFGYNDYGCLGNGKTINQNEPVRIDFSDESKIGNLSYRIDEFGCLTISGNGDMPDYTDKASLFYGRTDISQIIIEDDVTSIGAYAFQGMDGLMSITIPDSVAKINAHAFDGNNSMVYIKAEGVTEIGESAFKNCKNFSFELLNGLKTIGNEAFYGCTSIGNIIIPSSVETVGQNAFAKCGMTSVAFSDGLKTIPEGTFADCQNLTSVTIPYTVTKVDKNAFSGCQSLITVFYDGFEDEWNEIVIESGNDKLKSASVHWYEIGQTLDEELLEKTKLYTSDGGVMYKKVLERLETRLNDDSISQEDKVAMINNFYQAFDVTSLREGLEYTIDQTKGKTAFDYLTNNDAFLAYQFKWWLHNTAGGTMARGYMISEGWIYNNELKQYLDPKTYITGETVDIKNYKAMLLSFMQYKVDNGIADDAKKVVGYADKVRKYTEKIIGKMDESAKKNIRKDLDRFRIESYKMTQEEVREGMQKIWNKYKLTDTIENDKRVYHIEGFEELSKALKISGKTFKVVSTTLSDLLDIINVETKLETIEQYRKFLELVADGKDYLPGDLVIAANQLLKETIEPYQRQITNYIYDAAVSVDGAFDITKTLKKNIKESIKAKYPDLFKTDAAKFAATFGEAIAVIETSAVVVDALTKVGTVIKDASYVEAYAYLGQYFTILLRNKRDQFRANETIENAWEFYDMYHLLFRVRTCGENAYLKMCKESAVTNILAKVGFKWFDITDREQFVKDTFEYMNNYCFFGLDNADEIPASHKYAQKAVIKCPVDVEVYDKSGKLVYTINDGTELDETNNLGRFICRYDPKLGDYIKIIYLNDSNNYTLKTIGRDSGIVSIETAKTVSDSEVEAKKITGLPIEKNGIITVDLKKNEYEDDRYGDNKERITGNLQETDEEKLISVQSLSLTENSIVMKEGEKKAIGVVVQPVNASYTNVIWSSSDEGVAVVNAGAVTAVAPGTTTITAETYDGLFKAPCTVTVRPEGVLGDTNGDGTADIADALMVARYDAGLITLDSTQLSVSDVNNDGDADIADALMIARYDAGLIDSL